MARAKKAARAAGVPPRRAAASTDAANSGARVLLASTAISSHVPLLQETNLYS